MKINRNKCENIQNPKKFFDKTILSDFFVVEIVTIKYYKVNVKYLWLGLTDIIN